MTPDDIKTAIGYAFRKSFSQLNYVPKIDIDGLDALKLINLNREFDGKGEYSICIYASLYARMDDCSLSASNHYKLTTNVFITSNDENEPSISFTSPIYIKKDGI